MLADVMLEKLNLKTSAFNCLSAQHICKKLVSTQVCTGALVAPVANNCCEHGCFCGTEVVN